MFKPQFHFQPDFRGDQVLPSEERAGAAERRLGAVLNASNLWPYFYLIPQLGMGWARISPSKRETEPKRRKDTTNVPLSRRFTALGWDALQHRVRPPELLRDLSSPHPATTTPASLLPGF